MQSHQFADLEGDHWQIDYYALNRENPEPQTLISFRGAPILRVYPGYFARDEADSWYNALEDACEWSVGKVRIYGKYIDEPRQSMLCTAEGAPQYIYSGQQKQVLSFNEPTRAIIREITARGQFVHEPTAVLINRYSPAQYIAEHADDEKSLDRTRSIFSLSLGQRRVLAIREKKRPYAKITAERRKWRLEVPMEHGDLQEFCPSMQDWFSHEVIKPRKQELAALSADRFAARINMTFRVTK